MATLHIAWITTHEAAGSDPGAVVNEIISSEALTTSGASAKSGVKPDGATHALCRSLDSSHYITPEGATQDALVTNSVSVANGGYIVTRMKKGGQIAAITHA